MGSPTMAAGFAAALLEYAVGKGADRAQLLGASGLTEDALAKQDNRIELDAYHALIGAAISATKDGALLMRHTIDTKLETMSIVGQIVHSSDSMVHSVQQLNRYARLMADVDIMQGADRFEVAIEKDEVWIIDHLPQPNETPMAIEASFSRFISEFRRSFPDKVFGIELEVTYPPPPHVAAYAELLQIPVRFNGTRNALRIDRFWLHTDFDPGNEYIFGIFTDHADTLLAELDTSETTRAKVEAHILPELHTGTISMDKVARDLGMSRQTLYRRLQEEGLTFAEVHDDLRARMARDYLSARKVSVNETAYLLGFSEASSFVRAFKRWTGQSPTAFRDSLA
ncbi:MAG TPA: AraC family transcriptional regulator [Rhodobacterales bacterium]|nr:AraC family transcriptional regulator [Rhodobacterales bacterium]